MAVFTLLLGLALLAGGVGGGVVSGEDAEPAVVDEAGSTPLHLAAQADDADKVKELIAGGADIEAWDDDDATPLHRAVKHKSYRAMATLVGAGADVYAEDKKVMTPLSYAIKAQDLRAVQFLLDAGVSPNYITRDGQDLRLALEMALEGRSLDIVVALLKAGADPNAKTGYEPLIFKAILRSEAAVPILLAAGADLGKRNTPGDQPLHYALYSSRANAAEMMIQAGADINAADSSGKTPLFLAIREGLVDIVELLLARGAELEPLLSLPPHDQMHWPFDEKAREAVAAALDLLCAKWVESGKLEREGITPLQWMVDIGHAPGVKALLGAGASPSAPCSDGLPLLHRALREKQYKIFEMLLDAGGDVCAVSSNGENLLHLAPLPYLGRLLEAGLDVNAANHDGVTPLHRAARIFGAEEVARLLAAGADIRARDKSGATAMHYAAINVSQSGEATIAALRSAGLSVDEPDQYGRTPLHRAAELGWPEGIQRLVRMNADTDRRDKDMRTPLHLAYQRAPHKWGFRTLIEVGASEDAVDRLGLKPLELGLLAGRPWLLDDRDEGVRLYVEVLQKVLREGMSPEEPVDSFFPSHCIDCNQTSMTSAVEHAADLPEGHGTRWPGAWLQSVPLILAAVNSDSVDAVKVLLEAGASPNPRYDDGKGVLDWCVGARDFAPSILQQLLAHGLDPNSTDSQGIPFLHLAMYRWEDESLFWALVKAGADTKCTDRDDHTTLHVAAEAGSPKVVKYLLDAGLEVNARGRYDRTPLHCAMGRYWSDDEQEDKANCEVFALLLAAGADITARDALGLAPYHSAEDLPSDIRRALRGRKQR